jgi:hypothetical protein
MRSLFALLLATGTVVTMAPAANADPVRYHGVHPVAPRVHEGLCMIEGPHFHAYRPHKAVLYVKAERHWHFIGDPTEFGAKSMPRHAYYGHHPLVWIDADVGQHYCYITGPHHHLYAPSAEASFALKGDAYWFVGTHPRWYKRRRHRRMDRHYATVTLVRPVVTVTPPAGFVGFVAGAGGATMQAGVRAPSISVGVGLPSVGVVVGGGHTHHTTHVIHHHDGKRAHKVKVKRKRKGWRVHSKRRHKRHDD